MKRLAVLLLVAALACSGGEPPKQQAVNRDTLTQRQKDSILAQSTIPGASGVKRAMAAADSTSARVRASDTAGEGP